MGMTYKNVSVKELRTSEKDISIHFLVDSGAFHSLVPKEILKQLNIKPFKETQVVLADGTVLTRKVGEAFFELEGAGGTAPVIFGEKGEEPLLGATTLESLGLVLNPLSRELYPLKLKKRAI